MVLVFLLVGLFGAAALAFAMQNPDPVSVTFLGWRTTSLPLSFVILMSAFVGVVVASVSGFAQNIQLRLRIRELERRLTQVAEERWPLGQFREPIREPVREPVRERPMEPVTRPVSESLAAEARPPR